MSNFKVGDRVMCTKKEYVATPGEKGTIRVIEHHGDDHDFGVELDNNLGGNDLSMNDVGFKCEDGHGWWAAAKNIRLLENRFEIGQIYRVGKLSSQHQYENAIVKLVGNRSFWFTVKAIRGEAPNDFGKCSEYARALTILTGPQIGEAIRKWDEEHAKKSGVREVKRHAKSGEYIKIVTSFLPIGYKGGDILLVTKGFNDTSVICQGAKICVCDSEYVVLEGYKPEKEEHRKAKVGDTVKVLHDNGGRVYAGTVWKVKSIDSNGMLRITHDDDELTWACDKDNYIVLSSGKHSYTDEQIEKAKQIVLDTIREQAEQRKYVLFSNTVNDPQDNAGYYAYVTGGEGCHFGIIEDKDSRYYGAFISDSTERAGAKCSPNDEPNEWIGKCVALCKVLHKPIPAFIMEG